MCTSSLEVGVRIFVLHLKNKTIMFMYPTFIIIIIKVSYPHFINLGRAKGETLYKTIHIKLIYNSNQSIFQISTKKRFYINLSFFIVVPRNYLPLTYVLKIFKESPMSRVLIFTVQIIRQSLCK